MKLTPAALLVPLLALVAPVITTVIAQPSSPQPEPRELIYCADRMTHEEREAFLAKRRAARTLDEKQAIRAAHRAEMQGRVAGQAGITCEPPGRQWHGGRDK
jgi:hypothetical protein